MTNVISGEKLHCGVFDLRLVQRDQLDHRRVELVLVAHRRRAAFQVTDGSARLGDDECPLELPGVGGIDAEVGGQLHRAANTFGNVAEGTVTEDGGIQGGEEIVGIRHHGAQILADQFWELPHRFAEGAKNDSMLCELCFKRGGDGNTVKHGIHGDAGQPLLFAQGNAQLRISLQKLGIDFIETLGPVAFLFGSGVIDDLLVVDGRVADLRPGGLLHRQPVSIRLQTPRQQELRLILFL